MMHFMRDGGVGMWFVLAFGGAALVNAILYLRGPDDRRIAMLRMLTMATVFASLGAFATGVASTFRAVVGNPEWHGPDMPLIVMTGLAESMANVILGFSLLTITWLLASVGARRLD